MSDNTEKKLRTMTGRVISNKMDKTVSVLVERMIKHPVYGKYIKRSTKLLAHDEGNQCREGDVVTITSCRPISKRKTFRLVDILESAK
ncbi:MAG: 30S ribosomal protein S17 [Methylococcales bacterium]|nr:30S ribosomal protein S17 [Methylococcales bacterium]